MVAILIYDFMLLQQYFTFRCLMSGGNARGSQFSARMKGMPPTAWMKATMLEESRRDNRKNKRLRTIKSGRIIFSNEFCVVKCIVRNMSEAGANLRTDNSVDCPDRFTLVLQDGSAFECRVTWRRANLIGVSFAGRSSGPSGRFEYAK